MLLLRNNASFHAAVIGLREATTRTNYKKRISRLTTELEKKLAKQFAKHSVAFLKELGTFKTRFETPQINESLQYFNNLTRQWEFALLETISEDELTTTFNTTAQTQEMKNALQSSAESAMQLGAATLIALFDADQVFSLKNPRAVDYFNNYGADAVAGIEKTSIAQLRTILQSGVDQGWSYNQIAKSIREQFSDWSTKRAKRIAVTEVGNAYQEGNLIVARDLQASGLQMEKHWLTVGDNNVDPHCQANQDQDWIPIDQAFSSGVQRPLDHPGCRCVLQYRRKPA